MIWFPHHASDKVRFRSARFNICQPVMLTLPAVMPVYVASCDSFRRYLFKNRNVRAVNLAKQLCQLPKTTIINPSYFEAAIFHKSTKPARNSWCHMPAPDWLTPMQRGDSCIKNRTIPIWCNVAATCCIWRHVAATHMLHETITLQHGFMQRRRLVAATALHRVTPP